MRAGGAAVCGMRVCKDCSMEYVSLKAEESCCFPRFSCVLN